MTSIQTVQSILYIMRESGIIKILYWKIQKSDPPIDSTAAFSLPTSSITQSEEVKQGVVSRGQTDLPRNHIQTILTRDRTA